VFEVDDYVRFDKIKGAYRHVNQRLRQLSTEPERFRRLFDLRIVPFPAPERRDNATLSAALASWIPAPLAPRTTDAAGLAALRATRRGFAITSYSRLKEAEGGYQPPTLDETPPPALEKETLDAETAPRPLDLPGGAATGLFLHAVLEHAALGVLPPLASWASQPEVERLLETQRRRWDREPRHVDAAARLVHTALTAPIALPDGGVLPGIATAARVRREVDFLFPMRAHLDVAAQAGEDRLLRDRGFIRGVLDVLFEHDGKVYFADWKSDALPDYGPPALRAHVAANYDLQIQIYTVALFRLLGIRDQADSDRRFGGLVYLFLRGLTGDAEGRAGLYVARPTYAQVRAWEHGLVAPPAAARFPTEGF